MKKANLINPHSDLIISRMRDGISISKNQPQAKRSYVASFLELYEAPVSTYFLDSEDHHLGVNPVGLVIADFTCERDAIGNTVQNTMQYKTYMDLHLHNKQVMNSNQFHHKEHEIVTKDQRISVCIDYKFPWYDGEGKDLGIFGMGFAYSGNCAIFPLKPSIDFIMQIFLRFNKQFNFPPIYKAHKIHLTKREKNCIELLLKGYTSKMIGHELGLSHRTVEYYIENIKLKFDVCTKTALVSKILEHGMAPEAATYNIPCKVSRGNGKYPEY